MHYYIKPVQPKTVLLSSVEAGSFVRLPNSTDDVIYMVGQTTPTSISKRYMTNLSTGLVWELACDRLVVKYKPCGCIEFEQIG